MNDISSLLGVAPDDAARESSKEDGLMSMREDMSFILKICSQRKIGTILGILHWESVGDS